MNLRALKDQELHDQLASKVRNEKQILTEILHLLREVETRKLYCDYGCRSLFVYATKILNYSESEAYMRINAMKLIREIPEAESSLKSEELSLTNAAQAQKFFRKAVTRGQETSSSTNSSPDLHLNQNENDPLKKTFYSDSTSSPAISKSEKLMVIESLKNQATRKAKQILAEKLNVEEVSTRSEVRHLGNGQVELKAKTSLETYQQLTQIQDRLRSSMNCTKSNSENELCLAELVARLHQELFRPASPIAHRKPRINRRSVTPAMKIHIKKRDGHKCRNCGSTRHLEIDHIRPQALGGSHHPENLQTLCRPCNQRRSIKTFGIWHKR